MSEPLAVARQATFNTDPADSETASENSIRRGNIVIPIVPEEAKEDTEQNVASSGNSSPIYANGDPNIKNYRLSALKKRLQRVSGPPSSHGDSSEIEILSDVGLAGDSDTDIPPPLSLSASARKKLRKEPRIKVPSAKFDSTEPPIEEETAQDILAARTPSGSERNSDKISDSRTQKIRSDTIVVESPRKKSVTFNLSPDTSSNSLREREQGIDKRSENLTKKAVRTGSNQRSLLPASKTTQKHESKTFVKSVDKTKSEAVKQGDDLDSSLCESDWQSKSLPDKDTAKSPRAAAKSVNTQPQKATPDNTNCEVTEQVDSESTPRNKISPQRSLEGKSREQGKSNISVNSHTNPSKESNVAVTSRRVIENDKRIIADKYETDVKPSYNAPKPSLDSRERWAAQETASSEIKTSKSSHTEILLNRGVENTTDSHQTKAQEIQDKAENFEKNNLIRRSSLSQPQTPVISNFVDDVGGNETDISFLSDWNNDSVSGIPKKGRSSKEDSLTLEPEQASITAPNQLSYLSTTTKMETSDGYDYESETFEDVLKERNAMVKAERTYQRRIRQLEDELKGMVTQCQMLSDENKELRKTLESLKNKEEKADVAQTADSVELTSRVAKLETEKENLVNANDKLTSKLKEYELKNKQFDSVFVENTKLKTKNAELDRKVQGLEKQIDSLSTRVKDSDTEAENVRSGVSQQLKHLQYENKALQAQAKSLQSDNETLSLSLEEKRKELNELMRAMQTETSTETNLKESKVKLEKAQEEMDSVKKELEDMKKMLKESEENKNKLQGQLQQRDNDMKRVKAEFDTKDNLITDLRKNVEKVKQDLKKLEGDKQGFKDLEKDTAALKSRIGSLKAEIESSLSENQKLKHEREVMVAEIEKLRHETTAASDAILEGKKYFRKWENERETRNRAEVELAKKQEEIQILDSRLKEAGNKINVLYSRLKALEDEKAQRGSASMQEVETNNKILNDENKKLRQMLVERNIELTNKKAQQQAIDSRLRTLERKQKDAEVRVHQLSGWVEDIDPLTPKESKTETTEMTFKTVKKESLPPRHPMTSQSAHPALAVAQNSQLPTHRHRGEKSFEVTGPRIAYVSPRSRKQGVKRNTHSSLTPPPGWEESKGLFDGEPVNTTPCSLPLILDTKSLTPPDPHGGYFMLYKEKMKRLQDRKF